MIFVTVGTQIPFDRMMRMVDEIAPELGGEEIVAQSCDGQYRPQHFRPVRFIEPARFEQLIDQARVIVAHAGIGTILSALQRGKAIVVVPRRADLREHRNDHQMATAQSMARERALPVATTAAELLAAVRAARVAAPLSERPDASLIDAICRFIED